MPTLPKTFFKVASWQDGQSVSESSLKDWTTSNSWPQFLQRYS